MAGKRKTAGGGKPAGKTARQREPGAAPTDGGSAGGAGGGRDDRGKRMLDLVVMLLGARAPVPYREIKGQFKAYRGGNEEAGLRAFERDKADLLELGVPLRYVTPEDDDGIDEAGYTVDLRRYRMPEVHLTTDEVAALVLAGSVARAAPGTTYAEVVDLALKKLAFDAPPQPDTPGAPVPAAKKPREPVLVHFPRPADAAALAERLAVVEQGIGNRKRITLDYVNASGQFTHRELDPFGLFYRQGSWLLVGWCHKSNSVKSFRLDRILNLDVAPKPKSPDFERPAGFDVRKYAARSPWRFENEVAVEVAVEVHPPASVILAEDLGDGVTQTPAADGVVRLAFSCTNPDYLVSRVLAAKGALVVRAPAALQQRVREELDAVAALYSDKGTP